MSRRWNHGTGLGAQERRWRVAGVVLFLTAIALAALILLAASMAG